MQGCLLFGLVGVVFIIMGAASLLYLIEGNFIAIGIIMAVAFIINLIFTIKSKRDK